MPTANTDRPLRLLHVVSSVNPAWGGPTEVIRQFAAHHVAAGHRVEVATLDDARDPWVKDAAVPTHGLGNGRGGYAYDARWTPWLRENRERFDGVIINGIWQYQAFGAWRALARSRTPYLVFTHGMLDPWFKRTYPLKHLKKWLYWPWADYRVLRDADRVLFTCEEERRLARQSFWLYRCREEVVPFGTNPPPGEDARQREAFETRFPELKGRRILLFLGRIHEKKGIDLLIDGFAQEPSGLHLVVAGPDDHGYAREMKARALARGVATRITWAGMLSGELKWGALRSAEAFILPSHQENFGIAVAEALACGTPVLISDQVNIWREIRDAGAGIVDKDTCTGVQALIRSWEMLDDAGRRSMGIAAKACFFEHFDIARGVRRIESLILQGQVVR